MNDWMLARVLLHIINAIRTSKGLAPLPDAKRCSTMLCSKGISKRPLNGRYYLYNAHEAIAAAKITTPREAIAHKIAAAKKTHGSKHASSRDLLPIINGIRAKKRACIIDRQQKLILSLVSRKSTSH